MGIVGISMVYTTSVLLNLPISKHLLLIIFLLSISIYNINKKTDIKEDKISHPARAKFIKKYGSFILLGSIIAYIFGAILSFSINIYLGGLYIFTLIINLLYGKNFSLGPIKLSRLKKKFIIKNLIVAFTWAFMVTLMPVFFFNNTKTFQIILIFFFIFFKVFANTIFFDIRDIKGDRSVGIKTIPVYFGIKKTKLFLQKINIFSFSFLGLPAIFNVFPLSAYIVGLITIYSAAYIYMVGKTNINYLCDIFADGEYLVMAFLAVISSVVV